MKSGKTKWLILKQEQKLITRLQQLRVHQIDTMESWFGRVSWKSFLELNVIRGKTGEFRLHAISNAKASKLREHAVETDDTNLEFYKE